MRRLFLLLACVALLWACVVALSGGFAVSVAGVRVSSRSAVNPLLFALAGVAGALAASPRGHRVRVVAGDLRVFSAPTAALMIAASVVTVGFTRGALVAGGSDSYGYVSQAEAWAAGTFRFDEPLIRQFAGRLHRDTLVPLGYVAINDHGLVAPIYAPGFPMVMGVFGRLWGPEGVFAVVPLLAGVAVFATYVMGVRLAGPAVGIAAALLLATSPSFLYQVTAAPMSDVPVAAWWALSLALLLYEGRVAALLAGVSASVAILTRPNLVPLALVIIVALLWTVRRQRSSPRLVLQRAALFAAGLIPGCTTVALLNWFWYGSPLTSGYGRTADLYAWKNLLPNLASYPSWVLESHTPVVLAAFVSPWLASRAPQGAVPESEKRPIALAWLCFIFAVLASYLFYAVFDVWWYTRFLLPGFPPLLVLTALAIVAATIRLPPVWRIALPSVLVMMVVFHGLAYGSSRWALDARGERKYAAAAAFVATRLPSNAIFISMMHSGSLRYYSQRPTVRFDVLPPAQLDATIDILANAGYRPFFLLEPSELPLFQERYAGHSALAPLDWPPVAYLRQSGIRIYDPADRAVSLAGRQVLTETVP